MKTTIEILKEARELIAKEGGWTQGWYAKDATGEELYSSGDQYSAGNGPVCFCGLGAIRHASRNFYDDQPASRALIATVGGSFPAFNDAEGRTQAEVVAKFDEAIAAEEAKAAANV